MHVLRDFSFATEVWSSLLSPASIPPFFSEQRVPWLMENLANHCHRHFFVPWSVVFGITLEALWRARNEFIFKRKGYSPTMVGGMIHALIKDLKLVFLDQPVANVVHRDIKFLLLRWSPPMHDWIKLNSDGSFTSSNGHVACGGILRDHEGCFVVGFSVNRGNCC